MVENAKSGNKLADILAKCELFAFLSPGDRLSIAESTESRLIAAGTLIAATGAQGNEMYVLIDGVLEAFAEAGNEEVILQRLDAPGDHVGEMALRKTGDGRRGASIRSVTDSQVAVLDKGLFRQAMDLNPALAEHLEEVSKRQFKQLTLVERSMMYRALAMFDQQQGWSQEEHYSAGEVIFDQDEPGDAVYVIRSGSVRITREEDGEIVTLTTLGEGQAFGELAVMQGEARSATVTAESELDVIVFDRERFLEATASSPELHQYLGTLKNVYALSDGLATQFDGEFRGEPAVITVIRRDDGREAIVNHLIDGTLYSAQLDLPTDAVVDEYSFEDPSHNILRTLGLDDGELVRVHAEGPWNELSQIHKLLLENTMLSQQQMQRFEQTGNVFEAADGDAAARVRNTICQCLGITNKTIHSAIAHGAATLEELSQSTGATTVCGGCTAELAAMVGSTGQAVEIISEIDVAPGIRSFRFAPCATAGEAQEQEQLRTALPGQHVVVSADIDGIWVHRPYTITSPADCQEWREITIKREDHGFLSNWLFEHPENPEMQLSHPKGIFWVDLERHETLVCLVAGIGMTPALAVARSMDQSGSNHALHIDYSARTEQDFACRDELDAIAAKHGNISIHYRCTGAGQRLVLEDIQALNHEHDQARYLICGPTGFQEAMSRYLTEAGVAEDKINIEAFTAVGHAPIDPAADSNATSRWVPIAILGLSALYLLQSLLGWSWGALGHLQDGFAFQITTGSALLIYIVYQWYLPYLRITGQLQRAALPYHRHRQLGLLAPLLLFVHSTSLGFAYAAILSGGFILNAIIGAIDKTWIADTGKRQRFERYWLMLHVPLSMLVTALVLFHIVYALAYK